MKKVLIGVALCLTLLIASSAIAFGQATDVYQLTYFANATNILAIDQPIHIVNPGVQGDPADPQHHGDVCANIYVYDAANNLEECCSCKVTPDGELTLLLRKNLLQNPAVGSTARGVIKIVSSSSWTVGANSNTICDPSNVVSVVPNLRASMEHLELIPPANRFLFFDSTPFLALAPFEDSLLTPWEEQVQMEQACKNIYGTHACTCK